MNLKKPVSIILGTVFLLTLAYGLGRYHAVTAIIPPVHHFTISPFHHLNNDLNTLYQPG